MGALDVQLGLASYSLHCNMGKHPDCQWQSPHSVEWLVEVASELGLTGLQLEPLHFDASPQAMRRLGQFVRQAGLFLELGAAAIAQTDLPHLLELASLADAQVLSCPLGLDRRQPVAPQLRTAADNLRRVAKSATQFNVFVAVENRGDVTSEELVQVIEAVGSPYVGVCLDWSNSLALQEAPLETIQTLAPYALSSHIKDFEPAGHVALGEGELPLKAILERLLEGSDLNRLLLDIPFAPLPDLEETLACEQAQLRRSVEYARRQLKLGQS